MFNMGFQELLIIGIVAVLLFGKRLPDVARSLGQSYQQFRRGLQDIQSEVNSVSYSVRSAVNSATTPALPHDPPADEPSVPAFGYEEQLRATNDSGSTSTDQATTEHVHSNDVSV